MKVFVQIAEATSRETVGLLWDDPSSGFALKMASDSEVGALSWMQILGFLQYTLYNEAYMLACVKLA